MAKSSRPCDYPLGNNFMGDTVHIFSLISPSLLTVHGKRITVFFFFASKNLRTFLRMPLETCSQKAVNLQRNAVKKARYTCNRKTLFIARIIVLHKHKTNVRAAKTIHSHSRRIISYVRCLLQTESFVLEYMLWGFRDEKEHWIILHILATLGNLTWNP